MLAEALELTVKWPWVAVADVGVSTEKEAEGGRGLEALNRQSQQQMMGLATFVYEFTLRQHGTQMYHSHGDEMVQIGLGSMGF